MVDACTAPETAEDVYKMMIKNFERHYTSNRSATIGGDSISGVH